MTLVVFIVILSILVLVHETGHFVAAKLMGIKVEEFAFGLPFTPPIISLKFKGTKYSIYPLVFGGFVKLYGEEAAVEKDKKDSYWHRNKIQRMTVVVAGVVMNVVLALAGFGLLYSRVGVPVKNTDKVTIVEVATNSPAQAAGLKVKDRIVKVEGKAVASADEFTQLIKSWAGVGVNVTVQRGDTIPLFEGIAEQKVSEVTVYLTPRVKPPTGQGALGVAVVAYPYIETSKCSMVNVQCAMGVVGQGFKSTGMWMGRVVDGLRQIGKSLVALKAPEGVSGPVGIYQITGIIAQEGILPLIELVAILSVNLAVFNILPIPALDGGRLLFIWIEYFRRKRLSTEFEQLVNNWGMVALLALVALVTLQDLIRIGIVAKILGR